MAMGNYNRLKIQVNMTGMQELEQAAYKVDRLYKELMLALNEFRIAAGNVEAEINQPPAETDG